MVGTVDYLVSSGFLLDVLSKSRLPSESVRDRARLVSSDQSQEEIPSLLISPRKSPSFPSAPCKWFCGHEIIRNANRPCQSFFVPRYTVSVELGACKVEQEHHGSNDTLHGRNVAGRQYVITSTVRRDPAFTQVEDSAMRSTRVRDVH